VTELLFGAALALSYVLVLLVAWLTSRPKKFDPLKDCTIWEKCPKVNGGTCDEYCDMRWWSREYFNEAWKRED